MRRRIRFQNNAPITLDFVLISLAALVLGKMTGGMTTYRLFSVYRSSPLDLLTYPRFILHIFGHADLSHYIGNMMMVLVVGPGVEEHYGPTNLLKSIFITALVSGMVQWLFFPGYALLGASGIVFMLIVMSSLGGMKKEGVPITLVLVLILYIGREFLNGILMKDNISQLTHILGGTCGALLGFALHK